MGFIVLGMFAINPTGLEGSVAQMINHGITTGALFACVGVIYERYHTREMSKMSGLWQRLPIFSFFFILTAARFRRGSRPQRLHRRISLHRRHVRQEPDRGGDRLRGNDPGAYYLLWMIQRVLFGPLKEPLEHGEGHNGAETHSHEHDLAKPSTVRPIGWHEILGLTPLMVLIVFLGVYPKPMLDVVHEPVALLAERLDKAEADAAQTIAELKKKAEKPNPRAAKVTMSRRPSQPIQDVSR